MKEEALAWLAGEVGSEEKPALSKLAPVLLLPAAKCAEKAQPSPRQGGSSRPLGRICHQGVCSVYGGELPPGR